MSIKQNRGSLEKAERHWINPRTERGKRALGVGSEKEPGRRTWFKRQGELWSNKGQDLGYRELVHNKAEVPKLLLQN